jgi:hypothetical protein
MKRVIILLLLFLSLSSYSQTLKIPPMRNGGDKILHFTASYVISYTTYHYLQPKIGHKKAKTYSILTSLGVGIMKEIIDERYRKGWEAGDIYANTGGIILFRLDLSKNNRKKTWRSK